MAVFGVHVVVPRGYEYEAFAPGDVVPDWAVGLVGDHCLRSDDVPVADAEADEVTDDAPVSDAPDFTKPARRNARKK